MVNELNFTPSPDVVSAATDLAFVLMAAKDTSRLMQAFLEVLETNLADVAPALQAKLGKPVVELEAALNNLNQKLSKLLR